MRAPLLSSALSLACVACGTSAAPTDAGPTEDASAVEDSAPADAAGPAEWSFEILETRTVTALEMPREAHLVRASRPDGARSYLLYLPVARAGAPMVVFTQPYAGIDWTGEDLDARWAARGPGTHPDDEAPGYDGDDLIAYEPQSPQQATDASIVWLANQVAVVHAYGRFYAGGSIEDDALDAAAPYHFARTRDELDPRTPRRLGRQLGRVHGDVRRRTCARGRSAHRRRRALGPERLHRSLGLHGHAADRVPCARARRGVLLDVPPPHPREHRRTAAARDLHPLRSRRALRGLRHHDTRALAPR
jgi:hypothetical protein